MNQQRSRRFRAAQEAQEKEEERKEAIKLFEGESTTTVVTFASMLTFTDGGAAMGHPVSEATQNRKSWDSNAITPGTPFMDLLAASLRYWVSHKLNTDPGWKDVGNDPVIGVPNCELISRTSPLAGTSHHLGRICSRRRRAQNHGLDKKTAQSPGA
jgi:hypothetical protein